jgi:hypothetical protein
MIIGIAWQECLILGPLNFDFDRCVITQAITNTTSVGFEHTLIEIVNVFEMEFRWEKDIDHDARVT